MSSHSFAVKSLQIDSELYYIGGFGFFFFMFSSLRECKIMGLQEKLHNLCKDDYQLTKPGYRYQRDIYPINGALLLCCWAFGSTEMTEVYLPLSYLKSKLIQITKADCSGF